MPISGPASYVATIEEFLEHWGEVNALLGGSGLIVAEGRARSYLVGLQTDLEAARDVVTDGGVDRALARAALNTLIMELQGRMVEFNGRIRADAPGSIYERVLPVAFAVGDAEAAVREGLRAMARVWEKFNGQPEEPPPGLGLPLVLRGNLTLEDFNTAREALRDAYRALSAADVDLGLARQRRNDVQDLVYVVLKNYRLKVPQALPLGNALIDSLPALTPAGGHTPVPVTAAAVWDGPGEKAKITWGASSDGDLAEYQVRGVPGNDYQADDEVVLATVPAGGSREFFTDFALGAPGAQAGFKVYVVLTTGNERGSEAKFVTRPP